MLLSALLERALVMLVGRLLEGLNVGRLYYVDENIYSSESNEDKPARTLRWSLYRQPIPYTEGRGLAVETG